MRCLQFVEILISIGSPLGLLMTSRTQSDDAFLFVRVTLRPRWIEMMPRQERRPTDRTSVILFLP